MFDVNREFEIRLEGLPQVQAMLNQYNARQLQNKMRRAVRAGAKPFQGSLKSQAATMHGGGSNVPLSFQKVKAPKVTTRGGESGREIQAYVRPKSPLFNIFQPGAKSHRIAPKRGVLRGPAGSSGWTQKGRKRRGAFLAMRPVTHPGLKPRDVLEPAFLAKVEAAIDAVVASIFDVDRSAFLSNIDLGGGTVDVFFP